MTVEQDFAPSTRENIELTLKQSIVEVIRINGGLNNQLYKLTAEDGRKFVAKQYFKDDRDRLHREYHAFDYLGKLGLNVPKAFLSDGEKSYAVYSFEEGGSKKGADLTPLDLDSIILFIAGLQKINPIGLNEHFPDAVFSTRSFDEFLDITLFRIGRFEKYVDSGEMHPSIAKFIENINPCKEIRNNISQSRDVGQNRELYASKLDESQMRLSPVDFGPHNMIFKEDDSIVFIDFEYFGWDDPVKIVSNFVFHGGSRGLSTENRKYFIQKFKQQSPLQQEVVERLDLALQLSAIDWISILLWGITPEKMLSKNFSSSSIDVNKFFDSQLLQISERLRELENIKELNF